MINTHTGYHTLEDALFHRDKRPPRFLPLHLLQKAHGSCCEGMLTVPRRIRRLKPKNEAQKHDYSVTSLEQEELALVRPPPAASSQQEECLEPQEFLSLSVRLYKNLTDGWPAVANTGRRQTFKDG
jgi:hypothetical protein